MRSKFTAILSMALLFAPLSLLAASRNSEGVTLPNAVTIDGKQVPAGDYKIEWEGSGNVTATIQQGKKVIASVPATVIQTKSTYDGALDLQGNVLRAIQFKNNTLNFDQANAAAASPGQ